MSLFKVMYLSCPINMDPVDFKLSEFSGDSKFFTVCVNTRQGDMGPLEVWKKLWWQNCHLLVLHTCKSNLCVHLKSRLLGC